MTLFGDEHVERYRATDGAEGYHWRNDTTILLLTTKGRKSGEDRTSALIYRDWEDAQLVVASKGGADQPPAWFLNLEAEPAVTVQIKGDTFRANARIATADERPSMWEHMVQVWPDYANYQAKTSREIPVVILERTP
jgi:deazaflavin-dependent oxidoreductase (nitroreductase family)